VVDGISVDSSMSMHEIMESENAFLNRLDALISKKQELRIGENILEAI
jgi:hypothetical protein